MSKARTPEAMAVAAAELAVSATKAELDAAEATVQALHRKLDEAREGVYKARVAADALLPQCRMVSMRWRNDAEENSANVVILRKTPGGTLVVRRVGVDGGESRFKWLAPNGEYVYAESSRFYGGSTLKLRDVPPQFIPSAAP